MRDEVGKDGDMVYFKLPAEQAPKPKGAKKAAYAFVKCEQESNTKHYVSLSHDSSLQVCTQPFES